MAVLHTVLQHFMIKKKKKHGIYSVNLERGREGDGRRWYGERVDKRKREIERERERKRKLPGRKFGSKVCRRCRDAARVYVGV